MDGDAFAAYIRQVLAPELLPGTVVICDNLATHRNKDAAQALKDVGCWFLYLPPYSPDLNPIEMAFSKLKHTFEGSVLGPSIRCSMHWPKCATCSHRKNAGTTFARLAMDQVKGAKL